MEEEKEKRTDESTTDTPIQASYSNSIISQNNGFENNLSEMVLGYTESDQFVLWKNGKVYLKDITRFGSRNIQVFFGVSEEEAKRIYRKLPEWASRREIDVENMLGNGIFRRRGDESHTNFVIVNGEKSVEIMRAVGGEYKVVHLNEPIVNGKLINTSAEPWLNVEELEAALKEDATELLPQQFEDIALALAAWQFESVDMQLYLTAFIMLAPFHTLMKWRPYIWITGKRGTGKTNIFKLFLEGMYKGLAKSHDNPTDYSIIQDLNNTGIIPLLDNFEPSQKTQQLLKNFEIAGRGGTYTRGTTGTKPRFFKLNHMLWFNSVLVIPERAATDSRIVEFRLKAPPIRIEHLPETVSASKIVAGIINIWDDIEDMRNLYVQGMQKKYDGRMAENIGYAHALLQILDEFEKDEDEYKIPDFIANRTQVDEGMELLKTIMLSSVLPDYATDSFESSKEEVWKILKRDLSGTSSGIKRKGIWIIKQRNGERYITVEPTILTKELLKGTKYERNPELVRSLLESVKGVQKGDRKNVDNKTSRGILIPVEYLEQFKDDIAPL